MNKAKANVKLKSQLSLNCFHYESSCGVDVLALLVQQVEERRGFLADEVEAAAVVDVVDVVPGDALGPVLLLQGEEKPEARLAEYFPIDCCCCSETGAAGRRCRLIRHRAPLDKSCGLSERQFVCCSRSCSRNNWRFA